MHLLFEPTTPMDFNRLAKLRLEAMRESLEAVGRFNPERSIKRFKSTFSAERTTIVLAEQVLVGFFAITEKNDHMYLDHLYINPEHQSKGIGSKILDHLISDSKNKNLPLRLGALKGSRSNSFYQKHGFKLIKKDEWDNYYQIS